MFLKATTILGENYYVAVWWTILPPFHWKLSRLVNQNYKIHKYSKWSTMSTPFGSLYNVKWLDDICYSNIYPSFILNNYIDDGQSWALLVSYFRLFVMNCSSIYKHIIHWYFKKSKITLTKDLIQLVDPPTLPQIIWIMLLKGFFLEVFTFSWWLCSWTRHYKYKKSVKNHLVQNGHSWITSRQWIIFHHPTTHIYHI